jgi:hypothetical protein
LNWVSRWSRSVAGMDFRRLVQSMRGAKLIYERLASNHPAQQANRKLPCIDERSFNMRSPIFRLETLAPRSQS